MLSLRTEKQPKAQIQNECLTAVGGKKPQNNHLCPTFKVWCVGKRQGIKRKGKTLTTYLYGAVSKSHTPYSLRRRDNDSYVTNGTKSEDLSPQVLTSDKMG